MAGVHRVFSFPDTVDERAARLVASGVVVMALGVVLARQWWLLVPLAYGFVARVGWGPRFSPLALVVTRGVLPRLGGPARPVAGPPKRFAQAMGATFSLSAAVLHLAGASTAALVVLAMLAGAALLESGLGFCLGCVIFNRLMRWGVIPDSVCAECADIWSRPARVA